MISPTDGKFRLFQCQCQILTSGTRFKWVDLEKFQVVIVLVIGSFCKIFLSCFFLMPGYVFKLLFFFNIFFLIIYEYSSHFNITMHAVLQHQNIRRSTSGCNLF